MELHFSTILTTIVIDILNLDELGLDLDNLNQTINFINFNGLK